MTTWEIIRFVVEILAVIVGGGWLIRLLTVRSHVKQERAEAEKAEAQAKAEQIENIRKIVDEIYEPAFQNLKKTVQELRDEVNEVRRENDDLRNEIRVIKEENEKLKSENENLRKAIREINPEVIPSKRSENAKNQPRGGNGQFTKKEEQ